MPLETGSYISDLNSSNPAASDGLSQADDHLRLLKATVKATFPNLSGAVTATHTVINSAIQAVVDGISKLSDSGAFFASDPDTGVRRPEADKVALRAGGTDRITATTTGADVAGNFSASGTCAVTGAYSGGTGQLVPPGSLLDYAGTSAPTGYLLCFGQAVSRTDFAALYAAIGTTYGSGNGTTTFNLPDCRGRVSAGKDDMGGTSADRLTNPTGGLNGDTLGATGGSEVHTLSEPQLPAHDHGGSVGNTTAPADRINFRTSNLDLSGGNVEIQVVTWVGQTSPNRNDVDVPQAPHTHTIASAGSGAAHNNVQPTIIFNKIIKT